MIKSIQQIVGGRWQVVEIKIGFLTATVKQIYYGSIFPYYIGISTHSTTFIDKQIISLIKCTVYLDSLLTPIDSLLCKLKCDWETVSAKTDVSQLFRKSCCPTQQKLIGTLQDGILSKSVPCIFFVLYRDTLVFDVNEKWICQSQSVLP